MTKEILFLILTVFSGSLLFVGIRYLPDERWQFIATFPVKKDDNNLWKGINLTYYGLIIACAQTLALCIFIMLMGSIGASLVNIVLLGVTLTGFCVIAAKIFARIIEKKMHTFTVGGASFFGMIIAPLTVLLVNRVSAVSGDPLMFMLPFLAASAISYAFGEGFGRLACISFGCCYGKSVNAAGPLMEKLFSKCSSTFSGKTKKIAYEAGLDGCKVIPIQAMTSIIFVAVGIISIYLFLSARYAAAYGFTMLATQGWRFISETLRADFRGKGKFSAYQIMALLSCLYAILLAAFLPESGMNAPDVSRGLNCLWNPAVIIPVQMLWVAMFIYFGRSRVTGSTISLFVDREKI
jgi:hypothetical protein